MKTIKGTRTDKYAQHAPHLPLIRILKDKEYALEDGLADRIVELNGGTLVEEKAVDESEPSEEVDSSSEEIETPEDEEPILETPEPTPPVSKETSHKKGKNKSKR